MTTRLQPGDTAPDFTLPNDTGETVTLSDLRGGKCHRLLLPRRHDTGLHQAGLRLQRLARRLQAEGYTVLGISPDKAEKLAKFREQATA